MNKVIIFTGEWRSAGKLAKLAASIARLSSLGKVVKVVGSTTNAAAKNFRSSVDKPNILESIDNLSLERTNILTHTQTREPANQRHKPHYRYHR